MTAATYSSVPPQRGVGARFLASRFAAVVVVVLAIIALWYVAAFLLNAPAQFQADQNAQVDTGFVAFVKRTWNEPRPLLPSPHQVGIALYQSTVLLPPTSKRSLIYHAWVTLSSTLLGFAIGSLLGILLAVGIVHVRSLDRSLMPWVISSQTIPILAIAPMVIVVLAAINITGILPKAIISTYLSFFPVTVGMTKGLRSPEPIHLDLLRTYNATRWQAFWKLRWPSSLPFLFVSMKIAVAASLVGAIVGELPTGAVAGLGARLLTASYYSQTVQMWATLVLASLLAGLLVGVVGLTEYLTLRYTGAVRR
jgi:NitT/TauT family transport system permease protein